MTALSKSGVFTSMGLGILEVGEISGKFDESLRHYAKHEAQQAEDTIIALSRILPPVIYLIIVVYIITVFIVPGFMSYIGMIQANL